MFYSKRFCRFVKKHLWEVFHNDNFSWIKNREDEVISQSRITIKGSEYIPTFNGLLEI